MEGRAIAAKLKGPGPAKYRLPGTCGEGNHDITRKKMPAFSFGKRFTNNYESCSPGPSYMVPQFVTRTGRNSAPAYSLYGRQPERKGEKTPAPGNYSPEKYPIPNDKRAPVYSFGCRLPARRGDETPAPNAYKLPSLIGSQGVANHSAPAHSIAGKPKIGAYYEDLQKTPGPGTYTACDLNKYKTKGPAYSVKGRHEVRDKCIVPGPGAFYPEQVYMNKKAAPSFSFGIRHTEYMTMMNDDVATTTTTTATAGGGHLMNNTTPC